MGKHTKQRAETGIYPVWNCRYADCYVLHLPLRPSPKPRPADRSSILLLHGSERTMNSLNILSARVSPPQTPSPSRSNSFGNIFSSATETESRRNSREDILDEKAEYPSDNPELDQEDDRTVHEETPLLDKETSETKDPESKAVARVLLESEGRSRAKRAFLHTRRHRDCLL